LVLDWNKNYIFGKLMCFFYLYKKIKTNIETVGACSKSILSLKGRIEVNGEILLENERIWMFFWTDLVPKVE